MLKKTGTILGGIRELIQDRKFTEALKQLKSIDYSELSKEELGEFYILQSEASLYVGNYTFVPIDEAVEIFRRSPDTSNFAKSKFLKGWLLSVKGHYTDAAEVFLESHTSFMRCGDRQGNARSLAFLSDVQKSTGNIDSAIMNAKKSAEIYAELGREKNRISVTQNLCYFYFIAGRLQESRSGYADIESEIAEISDLSLTIYYEMSAIPHALLGNFATARKTIAKCESYIDKYAHERGVYFENLGWINILSGDYDTAEKALTSGLETARELESAPDLVSQIKRLFGDLYIATEKYDLAHKYATEALAVSEQTNKRPEIAACYRIFAQVDNHRGNDNEAREWFKKAIDLFRIIGSNYELAVTRYLAGVSGLYHSNERMAMLYLAREYFESENVKPYIEKSDTAMRSTAYVSAKPSHIGTPNIIAGSPDMKKLIKLAENVAQSKMTVLLTGETGTGKDLFASYIHHASYRKGKFVEVNCPQLSNHLFEAELFGNVKGAFTSADKDRVGRVELANNGTLFLNEIGDIPIHLQTKLLRIIETGEFEKVGSSKKLKTNCRIIAATNGDIEKMISEGTFRCDLYHRLKEIPIHLPSLHQRSDDIPELVKYFISKVGFKVNGNKKYVDDVIREFSRKDWPGNVRELSNEISRLYIESDKSVVKMAQQVNARESLTEQVELLQILNETGWNQREAGRQLGVSETTIRRRIHKYNILQKKLS